MGTKGRKRKRKPSSRFVWEDGDIERLTPEESRRTMDDWAARINEPGPTRRPRWEEEQLGALVRESRRRVKQQRSPGAPRKRPPEVYQKAFIAMRDARLVKDRTEANRRIAKKYQVSTETVRKVTVELDW